MLGMVNDKSKLAPVCLSLAEEVEEATLKEGITENAPFGKIYAYECDGLGHYKLMEDAGIPGLITMPYLGYGKLDDEVYKNSRKFALSPANPYYFTSKNADGIGSQHTASKGEMIWPMGIISRAITSADNDEIKHCIKMLKDTQAGTGFMHESFKGNNPKNFTRHWFAWANSFFGEMVWKVYRERRELL